MSISFSLFFIFLFFILKNKNNFKDINKLYLIICFLILLFTVQSAIYRYVIILPAVMAVLFNKNENDKYLIFLLGYLLSITDLIYFKSYLQIVSTSSMLTFVISCSILFRLINCFASDKIKFTSEIDRSWIPRRCFFEILIAFFTFAIKTNSIAIEHE